MSIKKVVTAMAVGIMGLGLIACGEDPHADVRGSWMTQIDEDCIVGLGIGEDDSYNVQYICMTTEGWDYGSAISEIEGGTIRWNTERDVTFIPQKSSCPDDKATWDAVLARSEENLVLGNPATGTLLAMRRVPDSDLTVSLLLQTGCWSDAGFTPGPVK